MKETIYKDDAIRIVNTFMLRSEIVSGLRELPSANPWIPITKSEPTTSDHVLVTLKWADDDYETCELDYWVEKASTTEWSKRIIDHVIAWKFKPEPYKENE